MKKAITTCLAVCLVLANVMAAEYYVSKETGKNGNAGTKDAPFKNIEKAAEKVQPGDKLYVAEGNYYGVRDKGFIMIKNPMENGRKVLVDNNRFFMNKQADVTLPGLGTFEYVWVKDFEDVERFNSAEGNEELKDVAPLKKVLNQAYLAGFLNATYKEKTDYDPNSPANEFRRAMGMNQTMKVQTDVSMFANRYPQDDAVKLFGAVKGFGAQAIK